MRILQVSTKDIGGGAEKVARTLFMAYRQQGHDSKLIVGQKSTSDPGIIEIPQPPISTPWARPCWILHGRLSPFEKRVPGIRRLRFWLRTLAQGWSNVERELGYEDFAYPGSHNLLDLVPQQPDVVHCHNLHGRYFDLRYLPRLSHHIPVVLTLHDAWLLSGHCAHSFACQRWKTGCGQCPDLTIPPAIHRDATAHNWRRKRRIYQNSRLFIVTPSQWLMDKVQDSMLAPAVQEAIVIPNGVDLTIFRPANQSDVRMQLGLPKEAFILLFAAYTIKSNPWKDYTTLRSAVDHLALLPWEHEVILVALGETAPLERLGNVEVRFVPFQDDPGVVASYYQAADVYLHAARADTFPNTVLESLACGTPVVATAVGGIIEQIVDGVTGYLVPPGDGAAMAERTAALLSSHILRKRMSLQAVDMVRHHYDLEKQVDRYLKWYEWVIGSAQCVTGERSNNARVA